MESAKEATDQDKKIERMKRGMFAANTKAAQFPEAEVCARQKPSKKKKSETSCLLRGAPRQRAVWASFAKSPGSLRQVLRRLRRVSEVASWPRLGRLGRVWRRLAGVWAGVPRLGCVSRASLASRGSGFGPGVVFRGRGFGPEMV